jgi:ribosome-binding factor A
MSSSKEPSQRQRRVAEAIRHALAELFERHDLREPALRDVSITVTEVRISPDLRRATAYVTPFAGGEVGEVLAGLGRARAYLRAQVARRVSLRFAPELEFEPDTSFDQATRIESLLRGEARHGERPEGET